MSVDPEELMFKINKNDRGDITGFSLTAKPEHYAECYCASFVPALGKGKASFMIEDGNIIFEHDGIDASEKLGMHGISDGGTYSAPIPPEDLEAMTELVTRSGRYADSKFGFKLDAAFLRGFTLYVKE